MPLTADELITQKHTRTFVQWDGAGGQRYFFGLDTQYHFIESATLPVNGGIDPVYVPSPQHSGRYRQVARTISAPGPVEATLQLHESWGSVQRLLANVNCPFNIYEVRGRCDDLSDFYRGGESSMWIYSGMQVSENIDLGTRTAQDSDDPQVLSVPLRGDAIYQVGALSFGEEAAAEVVVEVIDAVYGSTITCGDCGIPNNGSQVIYAITRANVGSPSAPGQIVYTVNGGVTWVTAAITGIGATAEPRYIGLAGSVLFVGTDATSLWYSPINKQTGAPTTWTSVTLPVAMNDAEVITPSNIVFVANSGQVYRTSDITIAPTLLASTGAGNLNRVHALEQTIVAVGANGAVAVSVNNGLSWALAVAPVAAALVAVQVVAPREFWVLSTANILYRTINSGATWTTIAFPGSGTGTGRDLVFASREVAYLSHDNSNTAFLAITMDGGGSWASQTTTWRVVNWPTFRRAARIAVPCSGNPTVDVNSVTLAGLATSGTDGLLLVSMANFV